MPKVSIQQKNYEYIYNKYLTPAGKDCKYATRDTENTEIQENIGNIKNIKIEGRIGGNNTSNESNNNELNLFDNCKRRQHHHNFHRLFCTANCRQL